ncbi:unnamed protein product [Boreogadus saida]
MVFVFYMCNRGVLPFKDPGGATGGHLFTGQGEHEQEEEDGGVQELFPLRWEVARPSVGMERANISPVEGYCPSQN